MTKELLQINQINIKKPSSALIKHQKQIPMMIEYGAIKELLQIKYQEAIQCYDKSISIKPTALRYYNKSIPLEKLNQLKEAEVCLMKALEMDPDDVDAKDRLKKIQEKQKG